MRTPWIWSVSLGRWWKVHVRLHMFFCLFAALLVYLFSNDNEAHWLGCTGVLVLFFSVLLHEIGHAIVARKLGGVADEIVIGPLGGLSPVRVPYEPHSELVALMAGTLVNAAVCFLCAVALTITPDAQIISLRDLLQPDLSVIRTVESQLENGEIPAFAVICCLTFWMNWCLILVNLIPAFPFDGGRSIHASR